MPPAPAAAGEGPSDQQVWGSNAENGPQSDVFINLLSSVLFARGGTAALSALGYQVLDSPGTCALKAACDGKPEAASFALDAKDGSYIATGAGQNRGLNPAKMGFSTFQSLSGRGRGVAFYLPFLQGVAKPAGPVRTTPAESPLWKLPTRLVVKVVHDEEVDVRMEWREDATREHNTAQWVMQDRFLNHTVKLKDADAVKGALTGLVTNAVMWRLNVAKESAGSLFWAGHNDVVSPFARGLAYALTGTGLPVFSSSSTNWNARAAAAAADLKPPGASSSTRADYLTLTPKFANGHRAFLAALPEGADSLSSQGAAAWAGLFYSAMIPKELLIARTYQLSQNAWISSTLKVKPPNALPDPAGGPCRWKADKDALSLRVMSAHNVSDSLSLALSVEKKFSFSGLDTAHRTGRSGVSVVSTSEPLVAAAVSYRFSQGNLQVVMEGVGKGAATLLLDKFNSSKTTVSLGARWEDGKRLQYGAGLSMEL